MLKQQVEALIQENSILKRAFAIQRERQKEFEDRGHEVNQLKQLVAQYQEQLRTLEVRLPSLDLMKFRNSFHGFIFIIRALCNPGAKIKF